MAFLHQLHWRPTIGDPDFIGWFTVVAYAVAAWLAWRAWARPTTGARPRFWLWISVLMVCLCFNKQLDLQSLLTEVGRALAREEGWYARRRRFQAFFVFSLLAAGPITGCWLAWRAGASLQKHWLLITGLMVLGTFVVVRAISFHHADDFLRTHLAGAKMTWVLELTGILLIGVAAAKARRAQDPPPPDR